MAAAAGDRSGVKSALPVNVSSRRIRGSTKLSSVVTAFKIICSNELFRSLREAGSAAADTLAPIGSGSAQTMAGGILSAS
ncbi:hypothetical protein SDC9_175096 [bioreactor metagenome]|uniref:Uncharacterized protein n=1 Tax=bioreactor metagenome TaxID=1076179 RepID=A0A645GP31_9ZZZZ